MTTAQTGSLVSAAQAYREKIFSMLVDRNPQEVMAQTATTLAGIVNKHSVAVLRTRPFPGNGRPTRSSAISPTANGCTDIVAG